MFHAGREIRFVSRHRLLGFGVNPTLFLQGANQFALLFNQCLGLAHALARQRYALLRNARTDTCISKRQQRAVSF